MWNPTSSALEHYKQWHVTQEVWEAAQEREDPGAIHPCDHWDALQCDCNGACSCHWHPDTPKV